MKAFLIIFLFVACGSQAFSQVYIGYGFAANILAPGGDRAIVKPDYGNIFRLDITGVSGRWLVAYESQGVKWRANEQSGFSYMRGDFVSLNYSLDITKGFFFAPGLTLNLRDKTSDIGVAALAGWRYNFGWCYVSPEARYMRLLDDRMDLFSFSPGIGIKLFDKVSGN